MKTRKAVLGLSGFLFLAGFFLISLLSFRADQLWAAEALLVDRHKNAGVNCDGCHKENPPSKPAPTSVCTDCHGDYAKIAEKTQNVKPQNPHESHLGDVECEKCHHLHKPSVNYCGSCHNFGFKVP